MDDAPAIMALLIPIIGAVALFTFLAIASRAEERRKTEEARSKYEFLKKLAESPGFDLEKYVRFQEIERAFEIRKKLDGQERTGWMLLAIGVGLVIFFYTLKGGAPVGVGAIPAAIGVALLISAYVRKRDLGKPSGPVQPEAR
ncbi:MAG: hypothetical protein ACRD6R_06645 [Candidatus Polarisedimenticolia bacterium]